MKLHRTQHGRPLFSVTVTMALLVALAAPAQHPLARESSSAADSGSPWWPEVSLTVWFQGYLADSSTSEPIDATYEIAAEIFDSEIGGSSLWGPEIHTDVSIVRGWFNIELGSTVSPLPDFVDPPHYLQLTIDGEVLSPRSKLASAPSAILSSEAIHPDGDWAIAGDNIYRELGHVGIGTETPEAELDIVGSVRTIGFQLTESPSPGHVLMSDAEGIGTWQPAPGTVGGGGTANFVPKFTAPTMINNSVIYEENGHVGIGTTETGGARANISNAGMIPALKVQNTSPSSDFAMMTLERTEPMTTGNFESIIEMKADSASTDGMFISCLAMGEATYDRRFRVNHDGFVRSEGGAFIHATGKSEALLVHNDLDDDAARVVDAVYTGTGEFNGTAVFGTSTPSDGHGKGARFIGGFIGSQNECWPTGSMVYYGATAECTGGSGYNYGLSASATGSNTNYGIYSYSAGGMESWAGYFMGDVRVTGSLVNPMGGMEIDHPSDPENRYLRHANVVSSEMKTVYDGTVSLDADGAAWIALPDWFEDLNRDIRYQLTPIGAPAPYLHVAEPVDGGSFRIAGGAPGMEVCWMITGVRRDPAATHMGLEIEGEKLPKNRGLYIVPEAHGAPPESGIGHMERVGQER